MVFGRREKPDVLDGRLDTVCTLDDRRGIVLGSATVSEQVGVPTDSGQPVQQLMAEPPVQERRLIGSLSQAAPLSVVPRGHDTEYDPPNAAGGDGHRRRGTCDRLDDRTTVPNAPTETSTSIPFVLAKKYRVTVTTYVRSCVETASATPNTTTPSASGTSEASVRIGTPSSVTTPTNEARV